MNLFAQSDLFGPQPMPVFYEGAEIGRAIYWGDVMTLLQQRGLSDKERATAIVHARRSPLGFFVEVPKIKTVRS